MSKFIVVTVAWITWIFVLAQTWAAVQQIRIFSGSQFTGESIVFKEEHTDLMDWKSFLKQTGSFCVTGHWDFFDLENFEYHNSSFATVSTVNTPFCANYSYYDFTKYNSARYQGPEDFNTPALALFEGATGHLTAGQQYVITDSAATNLKFAPTYALSYAGSSWTAFTGNDFDGEFECLQPNYSGSWVYTGFYYFPINSTFVLQSVVQGCDAIEVANNIEMYRSKLRSE